jgi:acetyl esterase/lipase
MWKIWRVIQLIAALVGVVAFGITYFFRATPAAVKPGSQPPLAAAALPPKLVRLTEMRPGIFFNSVTLPGPKEEQRVLGVYLPKAAMTQRNLPCVIIAPAGTRLFHGIDLSNGDVEEHLPYVKAGYMVVSYSLDGAIPKSKEQNKQAIQKAQAAFIAVNGGVNNGKTAITYAIERLHADPKHIIVAGHSSAATLALQLAAADPRVSACIAYAPCTNLEARMGEDLDQLDRLNPGAKAFFQTTSPWNNVAKLHCPIFLFHARDDSNVPFAESESFAQALKQAGGKVNFVATDSGDHYDSMIQQGIPAAQKWLAQRAW